MFDRILSQFYGTVWVILPERLQEIVAYLQSRAAIGRMPTADEVREFEARVPSRDDSNYSQAGSVGVVPIHGTIYPRGGVNSMSGATTGEAIIQGIRAARANKDVTSLVLDINSPGGSVVGTAEAANEVKAAAQVMPVHAVATHMAASGAYWIGSQATSLSVAPNGQVGSIGVIRIHEDHSGALEKQGVKISTITTSAFKDEGAPWGPLSEQATADRMVKMQEYHRQFVNAVAEGRNTTPERVNTQYGQGRMVLPDVAKAAGMIDRVATLEEVIAGARDKAAMKSRMSMQARVAAIGV